MNESTEAELAIIGALREDAPLWRYMRLSTLLTLIKGSIFIPTIDTLRKTDPTEATRVCKKTKEAFRKFG